MNSRYPYAVQLGPLLVQFDYPVKDVMSDRGRYYILFDPAVGVEMIGQFPNLIAVDETGAVLWTAELPTHQSSDVYYQMSGPRPLVASSFTSFNCEIDPDSGKIIRKEWYK